MQPYGTKEVEMILLDLDFDYKCKHCSEEILGRLWSQTWLLDYALQTKELYCECPGCGSWQVAQELDQQRDNVIVYVDFRPVLKEDFIEW